MLRSEIWQHREEERESYDARDLHVLLNLNNKFSNNTVHKFI